MQASNARAAWLFFISVLLMHVTGFLLAMHYTRIYMGDSYEYIYEALNIKQHLFFYAGNPAMPVTAEYMTFRPPLYPLLLAAVYSLTVNNWLVLVLQNLLSVFTICYLRKMLLELGYKPKYDWLLLLLLATYPAQFIHASTLEPEIVLQFFVLLYVRYFILLVQQKKAKYALVMSVALVLGLFTKPLLYPFAAIHFLMLLMLAFRWKMFRAGWIATALIPLLVIVGYNSWNASRTGKFHFTSNQSFNAVYYYYFYLSHKEGPDSAQAFLHTERAKIASLHSFKERYDYGNNRGKELLGQNFAPYMAYHMKNSARFFIDPGKGDIDLFTGRLSYGSLYHKTGGGFYATVKEKGWWRGTLFYLQYEPVMIVVLIVFFFNCIRLLGMFFFLRDRTQIGLVRAFIFFFLLYVALLTGPIATPRYVLPVSLLLCGLATLGFQSFAERRKKMIVSSKQ